MHFYEVPQQIAKYWASHCNHNSKGITNVYWRQLPLFEHFILNSEIVGSVYSLKILESINLKHTMGFVGKTFSIFHKLYFKSLSWKGNQIL